AMEWLNAQKIERFKPSDYRLIPSCKTGREIERLINSKRRSLFFYLGFPLRLAISLICFACFLFLGTMVGLFTGEKIEYCQQWKESMDIVFWRGTYARR